MVQKNITSKTNKNALFSDSFILIMPVRLQDCMFWMFLYIVATKVVTHFNNNGKGLKVHRQETKNLK